MGAQRQQQAVQLRRYRPSDAADTRRIFERAVREVASGHYSPEQIQAWAASEIKLAEWDARRQHAWTIVAVLDERPAGFADLTTSGELDMLFVSPDFARRGVASLLVRAVKDEARRRGLPRITTRASRTARLLFEKLGFVVDRANERNQVRGVTVPNFDMHWDVETSGR